MTVVTEFEQSLNRIFPDRLPARLGVAVSGGSDSVALLFLAADWSRNNGCTLEVATVNHGLRPEAPDEARLVQSLCERLDLNHSVLNWTDWEGDGNLQMQAREARYRLIGEWARDREIQHVLVGHTQDDQAETVLLRLARGSGVDGLSAISAVHEMGGTCWVRPLLDSRREDLRKYLEQAGASWCDDPSNEDARFDRVKIRQALALLDKVGVTKAGLAETANRMASAREVLRLAARNAVEGIAKVKGGSVVIERSKLFHLPAETRRRILVHSLRWVASAAYPPRNSALIGLEHDISTGSTATLHGCLITTGDKYIVISREVAALASVSVSPGQLWDNRWLLSGPAADGCIVGMTGPNGLSACPDWRETGLDRGTLLAGPAVWKEEILIAAPLAGLANGWRAELAHSEKHFYSSI